MQGDGISNTAWRAGFFVATAVLGVLLFKHLSIPLMWHDECSSAMFGRRVLEHGYPVVHGPKNIVYGLEAPLDVGVNEELDAYLGSPWGQYYVAALAESFARRVDDVYAKTLRMRLPFAFAGVLGLATLLLALLPAIERAPPRRWAFATLFVVLCCMSISLLLHLREVRYYALVVLLVGALLQIFLRRQFFDDIGSTLYSVVIVVLLFLLFNTFYPAFGVFVATAGLFHVGRALGGHAPDRIRRMLLDLVPLAVVSVAVMPLVVFYEIFEVTGALLRRYDTDHAYFARVADAIVMLLRYEILAPVLVTRIALVGLRWSPAAARADFSPMLQRRLDISDFLTLFVAVYVLVVSRTPFFYERYFIVVGPLLSGILLLDAFSLLTLSLQIREGVRPRGGVQRRIGLKGLSAAALAGAIVVAAGMAVVRLPELRGRFHEIRNVYRGPLDHVIPYLIESHDAPEDLIIATNYEGPCYMYYLGSRVLVGFFTPDLERDLAVQPDIIVPRPWGRGRRALASLAAAGEWSETEFPVEALKINNVPSLSARNQAGIVHRFRSPELSGEQVGFRILERVPDPRREGY